MSSIGHVLTFHSQNVSGNTFATNDHVALDGTLELIRRLRLPVLRLLAVVERLRRNEASKLPPRYVCITFDDGPDYDWLDVSHPVHGRQLSMFSILERHSRRLGPWWMSRACATSFVIASPEARSDISGPSSTNPDRMADTWWRAAQKSGLMDIGNHGWDHVHPSVRAMKGRGDLVEAFDKICTSAEAKLQIDTAFEFIRSKAGSDSARVFAYPYGKVSRYLAEEYLPAQTNVRAAFTTAGAPVMPDCDLWRAPRYVCGWHFKSVDDAERLLTGKA